MRLAITTLALATLAISSACSRDHQPSPVAAIDPPTFDAAMAEFTGSPAAALGATDSPSAAAPAQPTGPTIVHLVSRHGIITISASPEGPRYSIADRNHSLLAADLSEEQLSRRYPEIHRFVHSTYASSGNNVTPAPDSNDATPAIHADNRTTLDASILFPAPVDQLLLERTNNASIIHPDPSEHDWRITDCVLLPDDSIDPNPFDAAFQIEHSGTPDQTFEIDASIQPLR